jgi:hypothetical protein
VLKEKPGFCFVLEIKIVFMVFPLTISMGSFGYLSEIGAIWRIYNCLIELGRGFGDERW